MQLLFRSGRRRSTRRLTSSTGALAVPLPPSRLITCCSAFLHATTSSASSAASATPTRRRRHRTNSVHDQWPASSSATQAIIAATGASTSPRVVCTPLGTSRSWRMPSRSATADLVPRRPRHPSTATTTHQLHQRVPRRADRSATPRQCLRRRSSARRPCLRPVPHQLQRSPSQHRHMQQSCLPFKPRRHHMQVHPQLMQFQLLHVSTPW